MKYKHIEANKWVVDCDKHVAILTEKETGREWYFPVPKGNTPASIEKYCKLVEQEDIGVIRAFFNSIVTRVKGHVVLGNGWALLDAKLDGIVLLNTVSRVHTPRIQFTTPLEEATLVGTAERDGAKNNIHRLIAMLSKSNNIT